MSQVLDAPEIIQEHPNSSVMETLDAPRPSTVALDGKSRSTQPLYYRVVAAVWRAIFPRPRTSQRCEEQTTEMAVDRLIRTDPYLYIMTMFGS